MSNISPAPGTRQTGHKAIIAAVIAFAGSLLATIQGRTDLDTMRLVDWLIVILTAFVVAGGTYMLPNKPKA